MIRTASWMPCIALLLCSAVHGQESKAPVPDKATQEKLTKELKSLFKAEYAKRDLDNRKELAKMLLGEAANAGNANQRFALLIEARDVAAQAGDIDAAFDAIGQIVEQYDVRTAGPDWTPTAQKVAALAKARKAAKSREAATAIAEAYLTVAREGLEVGDYEAAAEAAKDAGSVARTARNRNLANEAKALAKELTALEKEFKGVQTAELKLSITADDPESNLTVGRFYCFVKGDWENGIPCLAKGKDAGLKAVAEKELAKPQDATGQAALGDVWYELSKKERGKVSKERYQERAREWYERALESADAFTKIRIKKKIKALPKPREAVVSGVDLLRLIDPKRDTVNGDWERTRSGLLCRTRIRGARILIPYIPPDEYDVLLVAERNEGAGDIIIGLAHAGRQFHVNIDAASGAFSGLALLDGNGPGKNETRTNGKRLTNGKASTITCSVRRKGVLLKVDGKEVFDWKGDFARLSTGAGWTVPNRKALFVGAWDSTYTIRKIILRPVTGTGKPLR